MLSGKKEGTVRQRNGILHGMFGKWGVTHRMQEAAEDEANDATLLTLFG